MWPWTSFKRTVCTAFDDKNIITGGSLLCDVRIWYFAWLGEDHRDGVKVSSIVSNARSSEELWTRHEC